VRTFCQKATSRASLTSVTDELPMVVSNRDFVELFLTVEFKPHAEPLSSSHIDKMLATLKEGASQTNDASSALDKSTLRRSCLNVQLPVETPECGEKKNFVRAYYGSVEVLRELDQQGTEWWMAVQSDSSGKVPLMFQEMSMPSKVAPVSDKGGITSEHACLISLYSQDVPLFIGWAVKQKQPSS
jgi:hypothetical protein